VKTIERHHWVNTVVGVIDAAWHLTPEEQIQCIRIVQAILDVLDIPDRGQAGAIPAALALEVDGGFYAAQIHASYDSGHDRPVRPRDAGAAFEMPFEAWRAGIVELFTSAYPALGEPEVLMWLTVRIGELLTAIGVPDRAPVFIPDDVARHASEYNTSE
jgi:hypothetical protein